MSCKLEPMIRTGEDGSKHLDGIMNAIVLKATNALGESMNAKIQKIKAQALRLPQSSTLPQRNHVPLGRT